MVGNARATSGLRCHSSTIKRTSMSYNKYRGNMRQLAYCFHHGGTQSQQRQSASSIGNQNDLQLYQRHQGCLCNAWHCKGSVLVVYLVQFYTRLGHWGRSKRHIIKNHEPLKHPLVHHDMATRPTLLTIISDSPCPQVWRPSSSLPNTVTFKFSLSNVHSSSSSPATSARWVHH